MATLIAAPAPIQPPAVAPGHVIAAIPPQPPAFALGVIPTAADVEVARTYKDRVLYARGILNNIVIADLHIQQAMTYEHEVLCAASQIQHTLVGGLATMHNAIQGSLNNMAGTLTTIQGQVTTLQGQVTTIQGQVTTLQGQVTTVQGNVTTLQGQVTTMQGDVTTLQGQVTNMQGGMSTLMSGQNLSKQRENREAQTPAHTIEYLYAVPPGSAPGTMPSIPPAPRPATLAELNTAGHLVLDPIAAHYGLHLPVGGATSWRNSAPHGGPGQYWTIAWKRQRMWTYLTSGQ